MAVAAEVPGRSVTSDDGWLADVHDKEELYRQLDDNAYKAIREVFARFYNSVAQNTVAVKNCATNTPEAPDFDFLADEFIKYATFDADLLADSKRLGIAVFFEKSSKPALNISRKGLMLYDPNWDCAPGKVNISFVPWSLFVHFATDCCECEGKYCLMEDEQFAHSDKVCATVRESFNRSYGGMPHNFDFAALGFARKEIELLFNSVKGLLGSLEIEDKNNVSDVEGPVVKTSRKGLFGRIISMLGHSKDGEVDNWG